MKTLKIGGERNLWFWAEWAGEQGYLCTGNFVISKCGFGLNQNKTPRVSKFPLKWKFWEFWFGNAEAGCFWYPPPAPDLQSEINFLVSLQPCCHQLPWGGGRFPGDTDGDISPGASLRITGLSALLWEPSVLPDFLGVARLGPGTYPVRAADTSDGWRGCVRKTGEGGGCWQSRRPSVISCKRPKPFIQQSCQSPSPGEAL